MFTLFGVGWGLVTFYINQAKSTVLNQAKDFPTSLTTSSHNSSIEQWHTHRWPGICGDVYLGLYPGTYTDDYL